MAKNKHSAGTAPPAPSMAAAGSSGTKEMVELQTLNKQLMKEIAQNRKQIGRLRLELVSLAPGQDDQDVLAASSVSKQIQNLKSLNIQLVKKVAESRKEIERLHSELASLAADQDIFVDMERDFFNLVLSSSLSEAAAKKTAEMAAVNKKAKSAASKHKALEMWMHDLLTEKDVIQRNIERIVEEKGLSVRFLEQTKKKIMDPELKRGGSIGKKWIHRVAVAAASIYIVAAIALVFIDMNLKNLL